MNAPTFAFHYIGDAYTTAGKIMGRQSAGQALMRGVARRWTDDTIHGQGPTRKHGEAMLAQLRGDGFVGTLRWRPVEGDEALEALGAVYYPAPVTPALAWARNARGPASYSLFGVTHTLSSHSAMEQVASLIMQPYQPWDGLICTSATARDVVCRLQAELREWYAEHVGATRFNTPAMPIIPLGVDAPAFARTPEETAAARVALGLGEADVAFLFAGRLTFHAKANPAPLYLALEAAAARVKQRLVLIEAGVAPNQSVHDGLRAAQAALAPSVRFVMVDGADQAAYEAAWKAADVFASISDNIQETFGLTPVEAMAAGLPVLVSDWNGYKDTVRDGVDGFRVATTAPDAALGAGGVLASRYASGADNYDFFIGSASMATVVDIGALAERIVTLASDEGLRKKMGEAGRQRAVTAFDWPVILDRYQDFAESLAELRAAGRRARPMSPQSRPLRPDPFLLFAEYPTRRLMGSSIAQALPAAEGALDSLLDLAMVNYMLGGDRLSPEVIRRVHAEVVSQTPAIDRLVESLDVPADQTVRALMWLMKVGLVGERS